VTLISGSSRSDQPPNLPGVLQVNHDAPILHSSLRQPSRYRSPSAKTSERRSAAHEQNGIESNKASAS
jgi:hypothetical protein